MIHNAKSLNGKQKEEIHEINKKHIATDHHIIISMISGLFPCRQVFIDYIVIMLSSSNRELWRQEQLNRQNLLMVKLLIKNIL